MKTNHLILLTILILQACSPAKAPESIADQIIQVESGLPKYPVYIEGDSTFSIEDRMAHYGVPGVSLAVINNFKIDWIKTYGVMDREDKTPVDTNTLFQAGSISKPVAAYAALKLVAQNKISLDSNINDYLKSWKLPDNEFTRTKKVTLRHLLSHTGGTTVHGFLGYSPDLPVPGLVQVLDGLPPANSPAIRVDKTPGESFRYSGGGISIMQQAMIDIEGRPFPSIVHDLVLEPLGMMHSTYDQPLSDAWLAHAATGYLPDGSMTKGKRHTYPEMAAAGLWTTAKDLALFAIDIQRTYNHKSTVVHTQNMVDHMLTPFVTDYIGLGIFIDKRKDEVYFGHGGWDEGFSSQMVAHRDKGYGVIILTNANQPEFIDELIDAVALTYNWNQYLPVYKKMDLSPQTIQQISGRYHKGNEKLIKIYADGDKVFLKTLEGKPSELFKISDTTFIIHEEDKPIKIKSNHQSKKMELTFLNPKSGAIESSYVSMLAHEKIPFEYLESGQFDSAYIAYQALIKSNPKDVAIEERNINGQGYELLGNGYNKLALEVFKLNTLLYPKSGNTYDSYAEALMKNKDFDLAKINYQKSLKLDPKNENAVTMLKKLEESK